MIQATRFLSDINNSEVSGNTQFCSRIIYDDMTSFSGCRQATGGPRRCLSTSLHVLWARRVYGRALLARGSRRYSVRRPMIRISASGVWAENLTIPVCSISLWRACQGGVHYCPLVRRPLDGWWWSDWNVDRDITRRCGPTRINVHWLAHHEEGWNDSLYNRNDIEAVQVYFWVIYGSIESIMVIFLSFYMVCAGTSVSPTSTISSPAHIP